MEGLRVTEIKVNHQGEVIGFCGVSANPPCFYNEPEPPSKSIDFKSDIDTSKDIQDVNQQKKQNLIESNLKREEF